MYEIFGWVPALKLRTHLQIIKVTTSLLGYCTKQSRLILVIDRDAATSSTSDAVPAQDVIDNSPALQNTNAVSQAKIIYAPDDTYTNESIQTYLELF